ncbi:MAG: hypothetical protein O2857_18675 [Planctomycetota bacterium]|nr:hypothetical protein [Planctomycetota bacterium]
MSSIYWPISAFDLRRLYSICQPDVPSGCWVHGIQFKDAFRTNWSGGVAFLLVGQLLNEMDLSVANPETSRKSRPKAA